MTTPINIESRNRMIFTIIDNRPEKIKSTQMAKFASEIFGISDKTAYNIWYNIKLIQKDDFFKTDVEDDIQKLIDQKIQETQSKNTTKGDLKSHIFKLQKAIKDQFSEKKLTSNLLAEIVHHLLKKEFGNKLDESRPFNAKKDDKSRVGYILNLIKGSAAKDGRKTKNAKPLTDQQKETIEKFLEERKEKNVKLKEPPKEMIEQPSSTTSQTNSLCKDCEALKEENTKLIDLIILIKNNHN